MTDKVTVEIYPWLSKAVGARHKVILIEQISKSETLRSLLTRIARKHEGISAMIYNLTHETLHEGIVIFVNNHSIPNDLAVRLKRGDRIAVTPFYTGG